MSNVPLKKILYAEDEPDIQTIAKMVLDSSGFIVELCGDGKEALQKAPSFSPDLILLDMMMPAMDGVTTLKELRKIPQMEKTPIVFMTAKVQANEVEQYKRLGAVDVIMKPFDPMTLSTRLEEIWKKYQESKKGGT